MTAPPLPASPCVRVRLDYTQTDTYRAGSRFYLSYAGSAPTPANCNSLASGIEAAWTAHLAQLVNEYTALTEVDVLDISTLTGASGVWTGSSAGTMDEASLPASIATNVEFGIARRYRGGKPRMFTPNPGVSAMLDGGHFTSAFTALAQDAMTDFFTAIAALSVGAVGALAHVNVSYYAGFKNITNSSGRERAVPTYRDTALVEAVQSYSAKSKMGSQKRRRTATAY